MAKNHLSRRQFFWLGAAAFLAALLPFSAKAFSSGKRRPQSQNPDNPNVLFITADDLGWKDLSCYGNTNLKTPALDALAGEGIQFNRAFGVSSSCSPSRASFITGQYINKHGVEGLVHRHLTKQLSPVTQTMPRYFQQAEYHTAIEGKWHVSLLPTTFYGYMQSMGSALIWKKHIKSTTAISKFFRARSQDGKPFYLELNFTDTHRKPNGKFEKDPDFAVDPDSIRVPEWMGLPNWPAIRADLALYYGGLKRMDYLIGRILTELQKNGLKDNTIVVFVSDNGAPYPGNKMTVLDRGIGTPLLVRYPGKVAPKRISEAMVSTIDIMPTVLELCNIQIASDVQGLSFAKLLHDDKIESHREQIFAEMIYHVDHVPMRAVRTERWKAIKNLNNRPIGLDDLANEPWALKLCELPDQPWLRPRPPFELYDLANDPQELRNLAGLPELEKVEASMRAVISNQWKHS